jgi:CRP/FNR family transcriptional regulator
LLQLLQRDFAVSLLILRSLSVKFLAFSKNHSDLLFHGSECRICRLLISLAHNFGVPVQEKIKLNLKLSQQSISDMLGINRGTTIKVFNRLKELDLLEHTNGYYIIKDIEGLREYLSECQVL